MKKCCYCKEFFPFCDFNKNRGRKDGLQSRCKPCDRKRANEYFLKNRDKQIITTAKCKLKRKIRNRNFILEYLKDKYCVDCGLVDIRVLEFDHIEPKNKKYEIANLVGDGYSLETIKFEIKKCNIRCSNCHKIRTIEQFGYYSYMEDGLEKFRDDSKAENL